jgi:hypothetical protein
MKHFVFFLFTVSTLYLKTQTISISNNNGSNSITYLTQSINMTASCIGFSTASTFTWASPSSFTTGSNVNVNTPSVYTVMIYSGNILVIQTFTIYQNTTPPTSSITSNSLLIGGSVVPAVTLTALSPTTGIRHEVYSPTGSTFVTSSSTVGYAAVSGPGTYTYCIFSEINGCSSCKTFTVSLMRTSINDYSEEDALKIYHNISGELIIKSAKKCTLSLHDIYGRHLKNISFNEYSDYKITVTDLDPGVYILISEGDRKKIKFTIK